MNKKYILGLITLLIISSGFFSFTKEAKAMTCNSATLTGYVSTYGEPTRARFTYAVDYNSVASGQGIIKTPVQTFNNDGDISQLISNLFENTTYYYRLEVTNQYGSDNGSIESFTTPACQNQNNTPQPAQVTVSLSADQTNISYDNNTILRWSSNNATSCNASGGSNGWSGNKSTNGSFSTGNLTNTTSYNISCTNGTSSDSKSVTVNVGGQPQTQNVQTCQNPTANNYGGALPCTFPAPTCTDYTATNYGGALPCKYPAQVQTCQNPTAINYGGSLPCTFQVLTCTDYTATNYGGALPCRYSNSNIRPTVTIDADDTSLDSDDSTIIRWDSNNADSCRASGGSNGWSGTIGTDGHFNTGDLTSDETYRITCTNDQSGLTASDSVTVNVDDNNNDNTPDVSTRSATNINTSNATLNGTVDGNGSSTRAWFEYGTDNGLGLTTNQSSYGSRSTNYSKSISGLAQNTTYYFRAVAENNSGDTDYGNILTFRTTGGSNFINNRPTVDIYADQNNLAFNGATVIRWSTTNATYCVASGGSTGWAGNKSIGPGSFYTGSLSFNRTYAITCSNNVGSDSDSVEVSVRGQTISNPAPTATSLVLITSSVDRNQPIVPTIDNTRPHPGDEINYTVSYQNIGTGAISRLTLQMNLPQEVDYIFSTPSNPNISGNTLTFNLGSLRANGEGTVTVRVKVRDNIPNGTNLNFPATLSYLDPSGQPQSVNANVSAEVLSSDTNVNLGANVFGAGFFPSSILGWILLLILILVLLLLAKSIFDQPNNNQAHTDNHHHS